MADILDGQMHLRNHLAVVRHDLRDEVARLYYLSGVRWTSRCTMPWSGCDDKAATCPDISSARSPAVVSAFSCVAAQNPHPGAGMLTGFPFATRGTSAPLKRNFPMA